jgi:hypothetical protein
MAELKRISTKMQQRYLHACDDIDTFVKDNLQDKEVRWSQGKYKGRKAVITNVSWERDWRNPDNIEILVIVKTERLDQQGYLAGTGFQDRIFTDLYEWFEGI